MRVRDKTPTVSNDVPDLQVSVDSLQRGLEILRVFNGQRHPMSVGDVASQLELPRATTARLTATLVAHGFLIPVPDTDLLRADTACHVLGNAVIWSEPIVRAAMPLMSGLAARALASVCLAVRERSTMLYLLEVRDDAHPIAEPALDGTCVPMLDAVVGRAWLWAQPSAVQGELIQRLRAEHGISNGSARMLDLYRAFQELEEHGYCVERSDTVQQRRTVAVPLQIAGVIDGALVCSLTRSCGVSDGELRQVGENLLVTLRDIIAACVCLPIQSWSV